MMECQYCKGKTRLRIRISLFGKNGLMVCLRCFKILRENSGKLYSEVVTRYCLLVYGYKYNYKFARLKGVR